MLITVVVPVIVIRRYQQGSGSKQSDDRESSNGGTFFHGQTPCLVGKAYVGISSLVGSYCTRKTSQNCPGDTLILSQLVARPGIATVFDKITPKPDVDSPIIRADGNPTE
jgi:hypothetical protein